MASLPELERRLDQIADRLTGAVEGVVERVIRGIAEEIVPATPVDTGFARANWRPSLNAPTESPVSFLDPSGAATVARIKAVARRFRVGDEFYLTNRVPYIGDLINGSSPQAESDFHKRAVQDGFNTAIESIRTFGLELD